MSSKSFNASLFPAKLLCISYALCILIGCSGKQKGSQDEIAEMEPAPIGMGAHPAGTMDFGEPLDVDFGNGFTLIGCKSGADRLRPGETAKVRLFIRCKEKQVGAVRCFGQLLLPSRNVINGGIFSMHRLSGVTQSVFFQKDEVLYSDVECQIPLGQVPSPLDIFAFLGVFAAERDTKSRESERNTVGKRIKISRIYVE